MKTIGIIGAMEEEITSLKSMMEVVSAKNIVGTDFFMGKMMGKNVVLVRCGIGKVNAAICTQILINMYAVDCIINIGVAGAIYEELNIGDIVISKDLVQYDFDVTATGERLGIIPRLKESFFKADEDLVRIAQISGSNILNDKKIFIARIATGDKFVSDNVNKLKIWNEFKAYCVEMEGASVAHTCYLNKIPFIVIRAMSDTAGIDAILDFENNLSEVAKNSSDIVLYMLKEM